MRLIVTATLADMREVMLAHESSLYDHRGATQLTEALA